MRPDARGITAVTDVAENVAGPHALAAADRYPLELQGRSRRRVDDGRQRLQQGRSARRCGAAAAYERREKHDADGCEPWTRGDRHDGSRYMLVPRPRTKNTTARIKPITNKIQAIFAATPASPVKPRTPAISATTRKTSA